MANSAGQYSKAALVRMIRAKRKVRPTADPFVYVVKSTLGAYNHRLLLSGDCEFVCISAECEAGRYGWSCWSARKANNPRRLASWARHHRKPAHVHSEAYKVARRGPVQVEVKEAASTLQ